MFVCACMCTGVGGVGGINPMEGLAQVDDGLRDRRQLGDLLQRKGVGILRERGFIKGGAAFTGGSEASIKGGAAFTGASVVSIKGGARQRSNDGLRDGRQPGNLLQRKCAGIHGSERGFNQGRHVAGTRGGAWATSP